MEEIDYNDDSKEGKLRRWVANLQLESWQLELLITGFSIFLLASSLEEYTAWREALKFDKLVKVQDNSVFITLVGRAITGSIPYAIRFFLISLLLHLLLRGFWIGIVGLSSVSNRIDYEKLNLKGPFKKYIPQKVRSLDDLIFYLDQVSSVIFAYTYLIVFSLISVALVGSFLFLIVGSINAVMMNINSGGLTAIALTVLGVLLIVATISAFIFFLDALLFSAFKRSKWFSVLFFPIYRFFSLISLSFIYRSIYYHLVTHYKRRQIIQVTVALALIAFFSQRLADWDRYTYFPISSIDNERVLRSSRYDDERESGYITRASIPSKIIDRSFLPLFIRYSPERNSVFSVFCPEFEGINEDLDFLDNVQAGMESQQDTTRTANEILDEKLLKKAKMDEVISCIQNTFEVLLDGKPIEADFSFGYHPNMGEKGFYQMINLENVARGRHVLSINQLEFQGNFMLDETTPESFKMVRLTDITFWKE